MDRLRPVVDSPGQSGKPLISVRNVSKTFSTSDGEVRALDDVTFEVEEGSIVGVLGPNGAGKTTLVRSILDLVIPTDGTIEIGGTSVEDWGSDLYTVTSSVLEGSRNVYWRLSVRENVDYFTGLQGIEPSSVAEANERLIEEVGLADKAGEPVKELSRGMKQKASLASSLARRTPIVFLDEPTLGLDVESSQRLVEFLKQIVEDDNRTIIITSHDMDTVRELCERVVVLNDGRIIADDRIENLLEAFDSHTYEFRLPELPDRSRERIERRFEGVSIERGENATTVRITTNDPDDFYEVVDSLERGDATVQAVDSPSADLESKFIDLVEEKRAEPTAGGGGR